MTKDTVTQKPNKDLIQRILLIAILVFASWHFTSHDVSVTHDTNAHEECQVCRVNHIPVADLPSLSWATPFFVISFFVATPFFLQLKNSYRNTLGARAPPLN